jgi:hypothetical protein
MLKNGQVATFLDDKDSKQCTADNMMPVDGQAFQKTGLANSKLLSTIPFIF